MGLFAGEMLISMVNDAVALLANAAIDVHQVTKMMVAHAEEMFLCTPRPVMVEVLVCLKHAKMMKNTTLVFASKNVEQVIKELDQYVGHVKDIQIQKNKIKNKKINKIKNFNQFKLFNIL